METIISKHHKMEMFPRFFSHLFHLRKHKIHKCFWKAPWWASQMSTQLQTEGPGSEAHLAKTPPCTLMAPGACKIRRG